MYLAKVIGTVVSTTKDEKLVGNKLLIVQKLSEKLSPIGDSEIAVDTVGAGTGELVIVSKGSSARYALGGRDTPADACIVGIVDTVEVNQQNG